MDPHKKHKTLFSFAPLTVTKGLWIAVEDFFIYVVYFAMYEMRKQEFGTKIHGVSFLIFASMENEITLL